MNLLCSGDENYDGLFKKKILNTFFQIKKHFKCNAMLSGVYLLI